MAQNGKHIKLEGRVFLTFNIEAVTGLHIGGSDVGVEIGGVDKTVIRDPLTHHPYIPGSSLKGKVRSLLEKYHGKEQNQRIGQGYLHSCQDAKEYETCEICQPFGVPGERDFATPTRLVVRDVFMDRKSAGRLADAQTDLPFTEVKTEVSIDRVTSAANPRQMERVPAGTAFGPAEMVYSIYSGDRCDPERDITHLATLVEGLQLLEEDYLGGLGSRGSGKIRLTDIKVRLRARGMAQPEELGAFESLADLRAALEALQESIRGKIAAPAS